MRRIAVKTAVAIMTLVIMASVMILPASALSSPPYVGYNYDPYGVSTAAPIGYLPDGTIDFEDMGLAQAMTSPQDMFVFDNKEIWITDSAGVVPPEAEQAEDVATEDAATEDAATEDAATEDAATEETKEEKEDSGVQVSASTQYGRIIVLDTNFKFLREYTSFTAEDGTEELIPSPQGLFVRYNKQTEQEEMFICCNLTVKDATGTERKDGYVICADMDGNIIRKYTRPDSPGTNIKDFQPLSVVVDDSNYLYLQAYGVLDGIIVYTYDKGEYESFYGANKVVLTWKLLVEQTIKKIFSRKATEGMLKAVPTEMSNMFIDEEGFIYTTTATATVEKELRVRKLNAAGSNTLKADVNSLVDVVFGDRDTGSFISGGQRLGSDTRLEDICVDANGVMACMDTERSRVYIYDQTCMLLTAFGYKSTGTAVEGSVAAATAIDQLSDGRYLILDGTRGTIVTYRPTEYMSMLLEANKFYTDGRYVEGEKYWRNVLKYDANFARGYAAIGKSLREQKDYEGSLYWLKQGQDRTSYSLALQEYRKEYLRENYMWFIPLVAVICVAAVALFRFIQKLLGIQRKKKKIKFS